MKCTVIYTCLIGAALVCCALFQNLIFRGFGWEKLPSSTFSKSFSGVEHRFFTNQIRIAKKELKEIHRKSSAPAISIAVSIENEIIWSAATGYQDIENKIIADTSTQFRIGSTSKALTSIALGKLIEKSSIHLDSTLQFYSNRFLNHPEITIRQLASHQSGIRNYGACFCFPVWEFYRNRSFESVAESIADFERDRLLFEPGNKFSYSTYNFTALSLAMEEASGTPFPEMMRLQVFRPLKMLYTQPDYKNRGRQLNKSVFYDIQDEDYKKASEVDLSNKWAGGGFISTPSDLVRAGNALLYEELLNAETIQQLIEPQKLSNGKINRQSYALGWRHSKTRRFFEGSKEIDIIHHGGMAVGSQSLLIILPEYKMVISLLLNKTGQQGRFELFEWLEPIVEIFIEATESEK